MDIILEIHTPGNGKTYEFTLDDEMNTAAAARAAAEEVVLFENGNIGLKADEAAFFQIRRGQALDAALTLRACGVLGGDRLLLL